MPHALSSALATRHEALVIRLTALHRDVSTLATRRGKAPLAEQVRILAEGLISDCAPFLERGHRLPVASPDLDGLCVQLGQVLAQLEAYERRHTVWDGEKSAWLWQLHAGHQPVLRLKPQSKAAAPKPSTGHFGESLREKLERMILIRRNQAYELGFVAGRAARIGPPAPAGYAEPDASAKNNPRLDGLD